MASERAGTNVPWPVAVSFLIRPLPETFALGDVYDTAGPLRVAFPNNRHVEAKIRQSLQILRDRGQVAPDVRRTVRLDLVMAARYVSRSQVARVAVEAWAATNVVCRRCESSLLLVAANAKLMDAVCRASAHEAQVNAIAGIAGNHLTAAAFGPMAERLQERALPDYLIASYARLRGSVLLAEFIEGEASTLDRLKARAPLAASARRAGRVGATIDPSGLERHVVPVHRSIGRSNAGRACNKPQEHHEQPNRASE